MSNKIEENPIISPKYLFNELENVANYSFVYLAQIESGNKIIEIYGEEHNTLMEDENIYREILKYDKDNKYLFLLEHATTLSILHEEEEKLYQENIITSGTELIYFEKSRKNSQYGSKNLVCIDNRIEVGFSSAIEEYNRIENINYAIKEFKKNNSFSECLKKGCLLLLEILKEEYEKFKEKSSYYNIEKYKEIYEIGIDTIKKQLYICRKILKMNIIKINEENSILDDEKISLGTIIMNTFIVIHENLVKLGSLLVDINIINAINSSSHKHILVFTGNNHAVRLSRYKKFISDEEETYGHPSSCFEETYYSGKNVNGLYETATPYPNGAGDHLDKIIKYVNK